VKLAIMLATVPLEPYAQLRPGGGRCRDKAFPRVGNDLLTRFNTIYADVGLGDPVNASNGTKSTLRQGDKTPL
jgi:hypothetical protein